MSKKNIISYRERFHLFSDDDLAYVVAPHENALVVIAKIKSNRCKVGTWGQRLFVRHLVLKTTRENRIDKNSFENVDSSIFGLAKRTPLPIKAINLMV